MSDSDVDDAVTSLPEQARRRIDEAFDRAISESRPEEKQRPRKRRRIEQDAQPGPSTEPPELAGGFLLDDNNNDGSDNADPIDAIFEDDDDDNKENENALSSTSQPPTHIPLALIPRALQLLDLDPSDAQVLSVFKNAASSWSDESKEERRRPRRVRHLSNLSDMDEDEDDESEAEQVVSRRDWRAVCAALIPSGHPMDSPLSSIEESDNDGDTRAVPEEESDSGSSAVDTGELEESDTSSDEYIPDSKRKAKAKAKAKSNTRPSQSNKSSPSKKPRQSKAKTSTPDISTLTSRQRQDILSAFALFFPSNPKGTRTDVSEEELSLCKKRLTIKDIANAAASIKEKITAEEIIEMLTYCSPSSTQNPTMSFQDFQQMMIAARLA
ncbi:hypothetical protein ACEPAF_2567 [Sanghuangporus sanghuang]